MGRELVISAPSLDPRSRALIPGGGAPGCASRLLPETLRNPFVFSPSHFSRTILSSYPADRAGRNLPCLPP